MEWSPLSVRYSTIEMTAIIIMYYFRQHWSCKQLKVQLNGFKKKKSTKTTTIHIKSINSTNNNSTGEIKGNATCQTPQTSSTTHKHTSHLSHSWKPTSSPKPSNRIQFFLFCFVFNDALCNHEMFRWSMYCCIECLGCTQCSGMCARLPALCC